MKKEEEGPYAREARRDDANEVRKAVTSFCMAIIAATWVLFDRGHIHDDHVLLAKLTFVLAVAAVLFVVVNRIFRIKHWTAIMADESIPLDAAATAWGRWSNRTFWAAPIAAGCAFVLFVITILA